MCTPTLKSKSCEAAFRICKYVAFHFYRAVPLGLRRFATKRCRARRVLCVCQSVRSILSRHQEAPAVAAFIDQTTLRFEHVAFW